MIGGSRPTYGLDESAHRLASAHECVATRPRYVAGRTTEVVLEGARRVLDNAPSQTAGETSVLRWLLDRDTHKRCTRGKCAMPGHTRRRVREMEQTARISSKATIRGDTREA